LNLDPGVERESSEREAKRTAYREESRRGDEAGRAEESEVRHSRSLRETPIFSMSVQRGSAPLLVDSETSEGWELVGRQNEDQSFTLYSVSERFLAFPLLSHL